MEPWEPVYRLGGYPAISQGRVGSKSRRRKTQELQIWQGIYFRVEARNDDTRYYPGYHGQKNLPIERDKALNERHYGALQGLNKADIGKQYGEEQLKIWRRSYDVPPPKDVTNLNPDGVSESLKDTAARTLPYFEAKIIPDVLSGKNVIVAAHGNSLRSIVMRLDSLTKEQVLELNIPTGVPLLYVYDNAGKITEHRYL